MRNGFLIFLLAAATACLYAADRLLWVMITDDSGDADAGCFLAICVAVLVVLAVSAVVTVGVGVMHPGSEVTHR